MGSSASKPARTLAKNATEAAKPISRSLPTLIHSVKQAPPVSPVSPVAPLATRSFGQPTSLKLQSEDTIAEIKGAHIPEAPENTRFNKKAMAMGILNVQNASLRINPNNPAYQMAVNRQRLVAQAKTERELNAPRTMVDAAELGRIVEDFHETAILNEHLMKQYNLSPNFIAKLNPRFRVALTEFRSMDESKEDAEEVETTGVGIDASVDKEKYYAYKEDQQQWLSMKKQRLAAYNAQFNPELFR